MWTQLWSTWLSSIVCEVQLPASWSSKEQGRHSWPWSAEPCIYTFGWLSFLCQSRPIQRLVPLFLPIILQCSSPQARVRCCFDINAPLLPALPCSCLLKQQSLSYEAVEYACKVANSGEKTQTCAMFLKCWRSPLHRVASDIVKSFSLQGCGSPLRHLVIAYPWDPLQLLHLLVQYTISSSAISYNT